MCQIANTLALEDTLNRIVLSALFILFISGTLPRYIPQTDMEPHAGSPEFEQMKSLVGTWEGLMPMDKGGEIMKMVVKYRLTAWG